ncbi:MAG: hypothetical protein ACI88A_000250 [Paraglaciecola sp.]|jgi:hypothetical protein
MINTSRISSGFDIEFQLGSGWFLTALQGLHEKGLLIPLGSLPALFDGMKITIDFVDIIFDETDNDLDITMTLADIIPFHVFAEIALSDDGRELILNTSLNGLSTTVPFDALSGLAATPIIIKLEGDDEHENVMAILANMDIRASSQNGQPLPAGEHLARGDVLAAQSFLPTDKQVALGLASASLSRFANDIWHKQLTDDNGNQPFPDADDNQGDWESVSMTISNGKVIATLKAVANVDTPIIDIIPDPDITVTVELIPSLVNGKLSFEINVDTNIDFGLLGDLLAAIVGGLIGFVIGLFTGNPIGGAIAGAAIGVVVLEVGEFIVGKVIAKVIQGKIDGQPLQQFFSCKNDVIHLATVEDQGQGLNLGFLDALPTSIPIFIDNPDPLHTRTVLISNVFDEISMDENGFAVEGTTTISERFLPVNATIIDKTKVGDTLSKLKYKTTSGDEVELDLVEILSRADQDDVPEPLRVVDTTADLVENKKDGKLPIACMHPVSIHREDTIITAIRFDTGLELDTQDTIMLQDAGALILPNLQLIHPTGSKPYFRAKADESIANNFESLPEF